MAHAILTTSNMMGTHIPSMLVNMKLAAEVDNGNVVAIGALADGEKEAFVASKPTVTTPLTGVALIAAPELFTDERIKNLDQWVNEAGKIVRGYRLHTGDEFGLTADGFDGTPAIGNAVELQASYKLKTVASATASSTQVGTIIAQDNKYFIVRVG